MWAILTMHQLILHLGDGFIRPISFSSTHSHLSLSLSLSLSPVSYDIILIK